MPTMTWRPDTCDCRIEERHGEGQGVVFERVLSKCAVHTSVADNQLYDVVLNGENRRKSSVHWHLISNTSLGLSDLQPDGSYTWKSGMGFSWVFTGTGSARVLEITIFGKTLTQQQRTAVQAWLDSTLGVGKVLLV